MGAENVYRIHYRGTYTDGTVFVDTYDTDEPVDIIPGKSPFPKMFEEAVMALQPGETVEIRIPAAEAYGLYDESLVVKKLRRELPGVPPAFSRLGIYLPHPVTGQIHQAKIVNVDPEYVTIDHNHEMAGCDLDYGIELLEIISPEG